VALQLQKERRDAAFISAIKEKESLLRWQREVVDGLRDEAEGTGTRKDTSLKGRLSSLEGFIEREEAKIVKTLERLRMVQLSDQSKFVDALISFLGKKEGSKLSAADLASIQNLLEERMFGTEKGGKKTEQTLASGYALSERSLRHSVMGSFSLLVGRCPSVLFLTSECKDGCVLRRKGRSSAELVHDTSVREFTFDAVLSFSTLHGYHSLDPDLIGLAVADGENCTVVIAGEERDRLSTLFGTDDAGGLFNVYLRSVFTFLHQRSLQRVRVDVKLVEVGLASVVDLLEESVLPPEETKKAKAVARVVTSEGEAEAIVFAAMKKRREVLREAGIDMLHTFFHLKMSAFDPVRREPVDGMLNPHSKCELPAHCQENR